MESVNHAAFLTSLPLTTTKSSCIKTQISQKRSMASKSGRTTKASIILAPGQGAQNLDMGKTWRSTCTKSAEIFTKADSILGTSLSPSGTQTLSELISSETSTSELLSRTDIAQPAIFVTSIASYEGLLQKDSTIKPALTAGLSLGEYSALTIAGAMSFESALKLVTLRGKAMQQAAENTQGSMLALIGSTEEIALQVVEKCKENNVLVAANFNAPGQVVLSGEIEAIERAQIYADKELGLRVARLDVAGAFHSPMMESAAKQLEQALKDTEIKIPDIHVMSNVTGLPHEHNPDRIRELLVKQLTCSVRWADCCTYVKNNDDFTGMNWMELAPGKTLGGIMRKIDRKIKVKNMSEAPVEAEV